MASIDAVINSSISAAIHRNFQQSHGSSTSERVATESGQGFASSRHPLNRMRIAPSNHHHQAREANPSLRRRAVEYVCARTLRDYFRVWGIRSTNQQKAPTKH